MPKTTPATNPRIQAARLLASIGGKNGTGASKKRSPEHYKRLADIKKAEKEIRLAQKEGKPAREIANLQAKLAHLRGK